MARSDQTSRFLAPAGMIAALVFAVLVWIAPTRWLDPSARASGLADAGVVDEGPPKPVGGETQKRPDWDRMGELLTAIRDPIVEAPPPPPPAPTDDDGDKTPVDDTPRARSTRLSWEYLGLVQQSDQVAALVRIGGNQRFFFVGEVVQDITTSNQRVEIVTVTADQLAVRVGEPDRADDQTFDRLGRTPQAQPIRNPARDPSRDPATASRR